MNISLIQKMGEAFPPNRFVFSISLGKAQVGQRYIEFILGDRAR